MYKCFYERLSTVIEGWRTQKNKEREVKVKKERRKRRKIQKRKEDCCMNAFMKDLYYSTVIEELE